MGNLDDILRDDDETQAMPSADAQKAQELSEANAKLLKKLSETNDAAHTAADVGLLQQINDRLAGRKAGKQRTRSATTAGDKTFDKVFAAFLVVGGVLGLVVGMIVAGLLETAMVGTRLEDVSGWIRLLVVLLVAGFGVFLGSAAHDKWRK